MTERLHFHFSLSCIGEGNGNPLQCSCLEDPRDGGAWWAAVYGVAQSRSGLKRLSSSSRKWDSPLHRISHTELQDKNWESKAKFPWDLIEFISITLPIAQAEHNNQCCSLRVTSYCSGPLAVKISQPSNIKICSVLIPRLLTWSLTFFLKLDSSTSKNVCVLHICIERTQFWDKHPED